MKKLLVTPVVLALVTAAASSASAQLSISARGGGGIPVSAFAQGAEGSEEEISLGGASSGFGMGLDATLTLSSRLGLYAGFDKVQFGCGEASCGTDGGYTLSGISAGVQMSPIRSRFFRPWVRGGVTFGALDGTHGATGRKLSSDRAPGFEVGAGVNIPVLGILSLSPQVRYVGQNTRVRVPGIEAPTAEQNVGYMVVDLGLGFGSPFGGRGR
jgi:hypothetical protein